VIQIFEARNFQDLTSQRVAKGNGGSQSYRGADHARARRMGVRRRRGRDARPRLKSDRGQVSQSELDAVFGRPLARPDRAAAASVSDMG
jgi:hypothetical protein